MEIGTVIWFVIMGLVGGIAHVIIDSEAWSELKEFSSFKRIVIGGIIGYLYYFLHSEWNFPNSVMVFVSAYAGQDFIKALLEKYAKSKEKGSGEK